MTMVSILVLAGLLAGQSPQDRRAEAERLARTGAHAEALERFQALASENPDDIDARVWVGRLHLWMEHPERADAVFRSILATHPDQREALIGLGLTLLALDRPTAAVTFLDRAEAAAPDDPDVLAAQGRAHQAAGHLRLAEAYSNRARVLRPADPDIREVHEQIRRVSAHWIGVTGFFESFDGSVPDAYSGTIDANFRLGDRLRVFGRGQWQEKFDEAESRGGGGLEWQPHQRVTLTGHALAGPNAVVLPQVDAFGELTFSGRGVDVSGSVRYVEFDRATAWIVSPGIVIWINERVAVSASYARSDTDASDTAESGTTNSGLFGLRVHVSPRLWIHGSYARGIESFDTLSLDRLGRFGADTIGGGFRLELPSLTAVHGSYEHQWRDDDTSMARVTLALVQRF